MLFPPTDEAVPFTCRSDDSSDFFDGDVELDPRLEEDELEPPRDGHSPAFNHGGSGCDTRDEGGKSDKDGVDE